VNHLTSAADVALDTEEDEMGAQWNQIRPLFDIPKWLTKLYRIIPYLGSRMLVERLSFANELATGFLEAAETCVYMCYSICTFCVLSELWVAYWPAMCFVYVRTVIGSWHAMY